MNGSVRFDWKSPEDRSRIKEIDLQTILGTDDLIPQAVIKHSMETLAREHGYMIQRGFDDLDEYEGVGLVLEDSVPLAIMRYKGHPEGTFTIYLPRKICDLDEITKRVSKIIHFLGVPDEWIEWQRKDDPDL